MLRPLADLAHFVDQRGDYLRMLLRVGAGGEVELVVVDQPLAIDQGPGRKLLLGGGLVRVPDHPGVHAAALEGGAGVGRRQVDGLDVGIFQAGLFQGAHQQVVHVGALVEDDLLALELGERADWRILRHQDRLAGGRRRFMGDVEQIGTRRLGEYRRGLAGDAEVDAADIQPFEQLRAAGEFGPLHPDALVREALLQRAAGLEQHQGAVFLIADPQGFGLGLGDGAESDGRGEQGGQTPTQSDSAHGALLCIECRGGRPARRLSGQ
ncbi:hypothetical protein D9M70_409390 [compost metagenome]